MNEQDIKQAAQRLIDSLLEKGTTDPEKRFSIQAQITIAQIALLTPLARIGSCSVNACNTDLHFEGRATGLYLCCSGSPKHCWQLK